MLTSPHFIEGETKAVTCLRSHSKSVAELRLEFRSQNSPVRALATDPHWEERYFSSDELWVSRAAGRKSGEAFSCAGGVNDPGKGLS